MSWLRRSEPYFELNIVEARFTQKAVRLKRVSVHTTVNDQSFPSDSVAPEPVDPVSPRFRCRWPDTNLKIQLFPWEGRRSIELTFWDRKRRRKICLGSVVFPIGTIIANNKTWPLKITVPATSTLFPELNIKVDLELKLHANEEAIESWAVVAGDDGPECLDMAALGEKSTRSSLESSAKSQPQNLLIPVPSLPDVSELESASDSPETTRPKSERPRKHKKIRKNRPQFTWDTGSNALGAVYLEIVSVHNLPRFRTLTGLSFDMDPFVVISFGKRTFKTSYRRHTLNPSFGQKLLFFVDKHELTFDLTFTVWDKDRITLNDKVAFASLSVQDVVRTGPHCDPETGLYDLSDYTSKTIVIPCPLVEKAVKGSRGKLKLTPELVVNVHYLPYPAIRQQLWRGIATMYDTGEQNALNVTQVKTMLSSLGSTLTDATIRSLFARFNPGVEINDLEPTITHDELIVSIEDLLNRSADLSAAASDLRQSSSIATGSALTSAVDLRLDTSSRIQSEEHSLNTNHDLISQLRTPDASRSMVSLIGAQENPVERIVFLRVCPMCQKQNLKRATESESMRHISMCASKQWSNSDTVLLDNRFVTKSQASQRWYTRILSKLYFGSYQLGANSANILVQDRITGQIEEEKMNVYVRIGIRVLYSTGPVETGRFQRMLRKYTLKQGIKYDNPNSASSIRPFIKFHKLDMSEVLLSIDEFQTFNEFFYRKLIPKARLPENIDEPRTAVSLADCRLSLFQDLKSAREIWIKGKTFSISGLIGAEYPEDVRLYSDCAVAIFRLAPQDYHRFHSPVDGVMGTPRHIPGQYYTVNPMAIRSELDVYGQNCRTIVPIDSPQFGRVMVVLIGAMMVGGIVITAEPGAMLKRTDEIGHFKFGGSTAVVLFEKGKIEFDKDLVVNSAAAIETLVRVGMSIGHTPDVPEFERTLDTRYQSIKRAHTAIVGGGSYMPFSLD